MSKKIRYIAFTAVCFVMCAAPFAGMIFARTDTTTENKKMAQMPEIKNEDGSWNTGFLEDLGTYYEDHFAFRPYLVMADSVIQSKVFGVSNVDSVIYGQNGWLYYKSTLDDYLGQNLMSDRALFNGAHNLALMQQYVTSRGADFLVTVPPNKNSLYGENMPYYYGRKVSSRKNIDGFEKQMEREQVSYLDLFALFEDRDEILYLERDSHWNNDGAVMVYNAIMDTLDLEHDTMENVDVSRSRDEIGDLNRMLYPVEQEPEWNTTYLFDQGFGYTDDRVKGVEDAVIETFCEDGSGSMLMFRDSFGNTLLPLVANAVENGAFYKTIPYDIEGLMEKHKPDVVVVEKVERNLREFAESPPVMTGLEVTLGQTEEEETETTVQMQSSQTNALYNEICGAIEEACVEENSRVYVRIVQEHSEKTYEAFTVSNETTDYGYLLYLPKADLEDGGLTVYVYVQNGDRAVCVQSQDFTIQENEIR